MANCRLNDWNENTKDNVHIVITPLCARKCKFCCNKFYDWSEIATVSDEELRACTNIYLTGGEPFLYSNPNNVARYFKGKYKNIKKVVVYTNAIELANYLKSGGKLDAINSLDVSIKTALDIFAFDEVISEHEEVKHMIDNRCYYFDKLRPGTKGNFEVIEREWQPEFQPATDSIFRKL